MGAADLLRFVTIGSVDDGKSTLIGRILVETGAVPEDQLAAVTRRDAAGVTTIDLANLTDGLEAERAQGITIDVAYRAFATARRRFIIADTPGHEEYTRNMATGASTADAAVILVDARRGVLPQTRRHAALAALLGIRMLVVAVNKMDLVGWRAELFHAVEEDLRSVLRAGGLAFDDVAFFPVSALGGDNVVRRSPAAPWYRGPALLSYLEEVPVAQVDAARPFAFPVQLVVRPHQDFRGYAGTVAAGVVRPGDRVVVLPSGRHTEVRTVETYDGPQPAAGPGESVVLTLADDVDVARGNILAAPAGPWRPTGRFGAHLVWMDQSPLAVGREYLVKQASGLVPARIEVGERLDLARLQPETATTLALNDIGHVSVTLGRPLVVDLYAKDRTAGSFIVIDRVTHATVAAGMIDEVGGVAVAAGASFAASRREEPVLRLLVGDAAGGAPIDLLGDPELRIAAAPLLELLGRRGHLAALRDSAVRPSATPTQES